MLGLATCHPLTFTLMLFPMNRFSCLLLTLLCASLLSAQNFDWVTHLPGLSEELANDLALGQSGNAYACGAFGNTMIFPNATETAVGSRDAFVVKFDEQGDVLWYTLLNSTFQEQALSLAIDSLENVYVLMEVGDTLHVQGNVLTGFNTFYLVVKLDSSGQYLDHFEPIAANNAAGLFIAALDVSPAGRISLGGVFGVFATNSQSITIGSQTLTLPVNPNNGFRVPQGFAAQYHPDGTVAWARRTNGSGNSYITHLAAAPEGGMAVCGAFGPVSGPGNSSFNFGAGTPTLSTDFGEAGFVARLDSSGNVLWAEAMQPGQPVASSFTRADAQKLAVDTTGAVYLSGQYVETVRWGNDSVNAFPPPFLGGVGDYGFVAKASPTGTPEWIVGISYADQGRATVEAMIADSNGVYLGGEYRDTLLLGTQGIFGGSSDIWLASLDGSTGQTNYLDAVNAPGFPDEATGLAVRPNGRLLVTGTVDPPANFGPIAIADPANSCCSNFFLASYGVGCAGPTANFTVDSAGVYLMNFTNQTTFTGPVTYQWDFGDGGTSIATNPAHTFPGPGFYQVTLTASDSCGVDSFFLNVLVPCQPGDFTTANFTLDNDTTNLTITVISNAPNATDAFWTFGDGNTSTAFNTSHQYNQPGTYEVCLVTQNFCNLDTLCQTIEADCDTSEIGFAFDSDTTNLTVTFTDQSVNVDDYFWSFGDGNTSNLANPVHQYNAPGTYTVCLITFGLCDIDTLCQQVVADCDTSEIGFAFTSDTTNLTVSFTDQSINVDDYFWSFGDGNTDTVANPVHQYNSPGTYDVCLITFGLCDIDTLCQQVVAACDTSEIGFSFTSDTTNLTLSFTDQSVNVEDYFWSFGDGNTDTVASPVHQYSQPGTYTVCLITFGPCDIDTLCQQVVAECDTSEIGFVFDSDTTNATVTFTDQSVNVEAYFWSFGDGRTDTVPSPVHQYNQPGTYTVCLITFGPCDIDTLCQQVVADCDTSEIGFAFTSDTTNLTVSFTDQSVNVEDYFWSFGDGRTDTVPSPVHQYNAPGTYTVCLITFGPCDIDTLCQEVVADCDTTAIGFVVDDISPTGVATIRNTTVNGTSYLWSFGDGSTDTVTNPVHQYQPGSYTLCLIAFGECDIDTLCETVNVLSVGMPGVTVPTWRVYPNPAQQQLTLTWVGTLAADHELTWYDAMGRCLERHTLEAGRERDWKLAVSTWPAGMYLLRIQGPNTVEAIWVQKR